MPTKSLLEVEVSTAEFQRYKALFDQYTEQLKKQPALWAAVAKQHKQLGQQFQHTAEAVDDEHKRLQDLNKVNTENERRLEKSKGLWADMAKSSESFAKNLTSASGFLSKWGGVLFGGVIGGAAFGIDRAVHDASSNRQQAMGLGASIGQLKAFQTDFGRIGDLSGQLQNVNDMETDPTKLGPWYQLQRFGLGKLTGDTVTDTEKYLDAQRKFAQWTIKTQGLGLLGNYAKAYGVQTPVDQLRLFAGTPAAEWNEMQKQSAADANRMNVPGSKALQDLSTQFGRNWSAIGSAFETQLARAAPLLGAFSDMLARITTKGVTHTGNAIAATGKDLSAWWDKAQTDPRGAYQDMALAPFKAAMGLAKQSWDAYGSIVAPPVSNALTSASNWVSPSVSSITASPQAYEAYLDRINGGLPTGLLSAVFKKESGGNLFPPNSKAGAMGPFQFMKGTAADLGINPYDPTQAAGGAKEYLSKLMVDFHGDLEKTLAAYNWGPQNVKALLGIQTLLGDSGSWLKYAPKETQDYVRKIEVLIHQAPGTNVTVAANQLAH